MTQDTTALALKDARKLALEACAGAGASPAVSASLVEATLSAAQFGPPELGFPHFVDYLRGMREGRIDGAAEPVIGQPLPAMIVSDARRGIAQHGFDRAFAQLAERARTLGIAVFTQRNSYTTGELGYYVRRLAAEGLIALAATNGPALMAASPGGRPVYCTNPLAFAAPAGQEGALVIDQASSAAAYYRIVHAAALGEAIPESWATDEHGAATTDPREALRGALLPFGGYKGANIALIVEVLSAGLSGAAWSLDAGDFHAGEKSPDAGLTVIALSPAAIAPDFAGRLAAHLRRLRGLGVHIPGAKAGLPPPGETDPVAIGLAVLDEIRGFASSSAKQER